MFDGSCFQEAMAIYLSPRATPGQKALGFTYAQLDMFLVAVGAVFVSEVAIPAGGLIVGTATAGSSLLLQAERLGNTPVTSVSQHVLFRHRDLLGISIRGNMADPSNPMVQQALRRINDITSSPDRVIATTFKGRQVFEYIVGQVGIVRDRATGEVITVLQRDADGMRKLQQFVDNGTAIWIK
jgi:hypothetical protein